MKLPPNKETALIFDWHRSERRASWLLGCLLVTAAGFALLFIIFRVVPPEVPKLNSRPQQMLVLNPAVLTDRALINRAADRSFTLMPSETGNLYEVPAAAQLPRFEPVVSQYELRLKAPKVGPISKARPLLFNYEQDLLPPLPVVTKQPKKAAPKSSLVAKIKADSAMQVLVLPPLADIPLTDTARPLFRVAVGRLGQVMMALPLVSAEEPAMMVKLHTALTQMRFQPTGKDISWAQVSFAWEKEAAP